MSHEGNIYFFACHMLYTAMQVNYEFQEQAVLEMSQLRASYSKWMPNHEELMGWALEEIVFPFEHENIDTDEAKGMGDFAEIHDEVIYKRVYDEILGFSYKLRENYPEFNLNVILYCCYCAFLVGILEEFSLIMSMESIMSTEYFRHYQLEIEVLKTFSATLKNEEILVQNIEQDILTFSETLSGEWREVVFTAIQAFENLSPSKT